MVVGARISGCGGGAYGGSGCGTDRGGGGYGRDRDRDGINLWEDNAEKIVLVTEPNSPLSYAPGLEPHHLIMSTLGGNGGRSDRETERAKIQC